MEIFEPAIVSLTVPDRRFASAVEACFSAAQLRVGFRLVFFLAPIHSVFGDGRTDLIFDLILGGGVVRWIDVRVPVRRRL